MNGLGRGIALTMASHSPPIASRSSIRRSVPTVSPDPFPAVVCALTVGSPVTWSSIRGNRETEIPATGPA